MGKHEVLMTELEGTIKHFNQESTSHKKMFRGFRYTVFILTAGSTALASLNLSVPNLQGILPGEFADSEEIIGTMINLAIVLVTAAVAVVTAIEGLRKPAELWIHERTIYYSLLDIKRELLFRTADGEKDISVNDLFEKMQAVLGSAGEKWSRNIVGVHVRSQGAASSSSSAGPAVAARAPESK